MEWRCHGHTAAGEHPAPPPLCRLRSAPLARLASTPPTSRLCASASPASLGPERAGAQGRHDCLSSDTFSRPACAFPPVMGGTAGSPCSNGCRRADHAHPLRDPRPPGILSWPDHRLTLPCLQQVRPFFGEAGFSERFLLSLLLDYPSFLRLCFSFSFPLSLFLPSDLLSLSLKRTGSVENGYTISALSLRMSWV
jgi:hypothetical protein